MDPRLLRYYNEELRHLREMGGEFAKAFPKIASRLGIEGLEVDADRARVSAKPRRVFPS